MADGVAVAERREDLVHARRAAGRRHAVLAPAGARPRRGVRPAGSASTRGGGRPIAAAARQPAGQRLDRAPGAAALRAFEHVEILALDDRPGVVAGEELAAVPPEPRVQRTVRLERVERFGELLVALVVQAGAAADALPLQHVAAAVGEHRPAERPGLERHHRQALEVRRHDQQIGGGQRVELVLVRQESEVMDAVVLRDRHDRLADEHQIEAAREGRARSAESSRTARRSPCSRRSGRCRSQTAGARRTCRRKRAGIGALRHLRSDADDDARHVAVAGRRLDHRALFVRVVHDGAHAAEDRAEDRQADRRIALRGRHEHGLAGDAARAVERVVVAVAEEDDEVEAGGRSRRGSRPAPGSPALRCRARRARRRSSAACSKTRARPPAELERLAFVRDRKASHRDAVDLLDAGRQLVAPGDVVARAGRDDFDLGVPREPLGDVARVQLRAAVDVGAVALNDDRELHDSFGSPAPRSPAPGSSDGSNPPRVARRPARRPAPGRRRSGARADRAAAGRGGAAAARAARPVRPR